MTSNSSILTDHTEDRFIISEGTAKFEEYSLKASLIALDNSFLLLISDQPLFGIGTVNLTIPPSQINPTATNAPFILYGMKNPLLTNVIGKTASTRLKLPVISFIYIKNDIIKPEIILKTAILALNQAIERIEQKIAKN
jgi:hypothetical protein